MNKDKNDKSKDVKSTSKISTVKTAVKKAPASELGKARSVQKKNENTQAKTSISESSKTKTSKVETTKTSVSSTPVKPRLLDFYRQKIVPMIMREMSYKNVMLVPKITKIVLNMRIGDLLRDKGRVQEAREVLSDIAGQYAVVVPAKKSIAAFKVRQGMPSAVKVTLRGPKMYYFLDRLINIALPRVRDFYGLNERSFDQDNNFSMGVKEHIIFPEVIYDKVTKVRGFDITICTNAADKDIALLLLSGFNLPFKKYSTQRRELWPVKD